MKGKVAALVAPQEVTIKEFDIPDPEPSAVLVRVRRANVCGSDIHIWHFNHLIIKQAGLGDEVVDLKEHSTVEQRVARVKSLTAGYGPDVVLEVTGIPAAFAESVQLVRPGERVVEIGNVSVGPAFETPLSPGFITRKAIRIQGFVRYEPWFLYKALQFLQRQHTAYPFNRLTDREYGLSEVAEAIRGTEAKAVARPVITPEAE